MPFLRQLFASNQFQLTCNDNLEHKTKAERKDGKKKLMKKRDRWPRRIVD